MTSGLARLYAVLVGVVAFFVAWAAVAAHPWRATARDPGLAALAERRTQLQHDAAWTRRVLARRYASYRGAFVQREHQIAQARAEQAQLDAAAARAWARYRASAPVRTVTVSTPVAAGPAPVAVLASAAAAGGPVTAPAAAPAPTTAAPVPAPAPPPPPVVSIPPAVTSQPS